MAVDRYNREINYLRVSITDRCNLRCVYCMPKEGLSLIGHDDILRYEEILRIVGVAVSIGVSKVRITGGEPLVRRGVVEFIQTLASTEGLKDISLTTNGTLLEVYGEKLFHAGIKRVNISLDSLNAGKYTFITGGGDLNAVLRGIEKVYRIGYSPIKINVVAIKGFNDDEILDFAKLSLDKPYQIRFIELMSLGSVKLDHANQYISNSTVRETISGHYRLESVNIKTNRTDGPAEICKIASARGEIGFISPLSHQFCQSCNRLRLTADGHLRACLLSDVEVDLKGPLRNGCSDRELRELMRDAIAKKPMHHELSCDERQRKKCVKEMPSIGG